MTGTEALVQATRALSLAGVPDPARDARWLLSHAMGIPSGRLTLVLPDPVAPDVVTAFDALVSRRARREPVSHLTGRRAFYGRDFLVTGDVLDPRPETEVLVEAALGHPFGQVLDLGTGSGCILVTLLAEVPHAVGTGLDLSPEALSVAMHNAAMHGVFERADFALSDWAAEAEGDYDLIVANPPYIAAWEMSGLAPEVRDWEPRMALTDEADGLDCYRTILAQAPGILAPEGRLLLEIGPMQADAVRAIGISHGLDPVAVIKDMDGRDRVVAFVVSEIPL
jgi:release factor glutamine methyltransferase